jgi:hypothetical protein
MTNDAHNAGSEQPNDDGRKVKPPPRKPNGGEANSEQTKRAKIYPPADAMDLHGLVVPSQDDPLTSTTIHHVPVGKPKSFFRVHPDPEYRKKFYIYTLKQEGVVGEQYFIVADSMRAFVDEAQLSILATCIYRDGSFRLWPLKLPGEGEKDMVAWSTARAAARESIGWWTKIVWKGGNGYKSTPAQPGYAPDPDWSKLPSYGEILAIALGESGVIRDEDHPVYRDHILGAARQRSADDGDDL